MKKIISVLCIAIFLSFGFNAHALETTLLSMRKKIFEESKQIKVSLASSRDAILFTAQFDACVIAISQLDAYFSMLGIFNTVKKEDIKQTQLDYLTGWLLEIKETNKLNIKNLDIAMGRVIEENTKPGIERLKKLFINLNNQIDLDLAKISLMKKAWKK